MLSGGKGQLYGSAYTWTFASGWQFYLGTAGSDAIHDLGALFFFPAMAGSGSGSRPHGRHRGVGTYGTLQTRVSQSDFCTASKTPDGSFVVAYMPTARAITVNMANLKAPANAKWFDPTSGTYTTIPGGPFANTGTRQFTPQGKNQDGDNDWVLLLDASGSR